MKNNKGDFITELLKSKELNVSQKERIFQLVAKEKDLTVLMEIDAIKEELQSIKDIMSSGKADFDFNEVIITEEMLSMFDDGSGTQMASNKNVMEKFKPDLTINDPITYYNIDENKTLSQIVASRKQEAKEDKNPKNPEFKTIIHQPKQLVAYLKNFSKNDSALKYTTHSWDGGRDAGIFKDIKDFLKIARSEYAKFSFQLKGLSENLNGKIFNFLFNENIGEKGWGIHRLKFGWSSPEIVQECLLDQNLKPEDIIIPEQYQMQISNKTIQKFKHVIDVFKNEIEIRDENSTIKNMIVQKHDKYLTSFEDPIIKNLDNKTFYTDVQWISNALDLIFESIQDRGSQNNKVSYSINEQNEEAYMLEILHINSFNAGKSIYDEKLQLVKGSFGDISKYLNNLCDWSIESEFKEGFFRINFLSSNPEIHPYEKLDHAEGFKHILTFYK